MLTNRKNGMIYPTSAGFDMANHDANIAYIVSEIYRAYGHRCVVNRKSLHKFGRFKSLGAVESEINYLGIDPVHSATNSITHFSSTDAADTQTLMVEGYTISAGDLTFVVQDIVLNGQAKTALTTPVSRVTRIANITSATETAGDVYVYEDGVITAGIPNDLDTVGNVMSAVDQATLFAGTSVASSNYFICTGYYAYIAKRTTGFADIKFKSREISSVYRTIQVVGIGESSSATQVFNPPKIIVPNSDIDMRATGSTANIDVCAGFDGYFADIV